MVSQPKEARAVFQLTVLKVGKGSNAELVLQSDKPVWFRTHWVANRQYLCPRVEEGDDVCPCCFMNVPRVTGFAVVTAVSGNAIRPFLFEFSDAAWAKLQMLSQMSELEVKPGLLFSASRRSFRRPVDLEPLAQVKGFTSQLAVERTLLGAVAVLFGLPIPAEGQEAAAWWFTAAPYAALKLRTAIAKEG